MKIFIRKDVAAWCAVVRLADPNLLLWLMDNGQPMFAVFNKTLTPRIADETRWEEASPLCAREIMRQVSEAFDSGQKASAKMKKIVEAFRCLAEN